MKRQVWREVEGGRAPMQVSTSGSMLPGPEARSRSASSRTRTRVRLRPEMVSEPDVVMWSARRPGVAMTMWGREERARA